jgi:hypothetical protein
MLSIWTIRKLFRCRKALGNNAEYTDRASVEALRVSYPAYDASPAHWLSALPELDLLLSKGGIMIVGEVIKSEPKIF